LGKVIVRVAGLSNSNPSGSNWTEETGLPPEMLVGGALLQPGNRDANIMTSISLDMILEIGFMGEPPSDCNQWR